MWSASETLQLGKHRLYASVFVMVSAPNWPSALRRNAYSEALSTDPILCHRDAVRKRLRKGGLADSRRRRSLGQSLKGLYWLQEPRNERGAAGVAQCPPQAS